jgi:hypothetical protein
MVIYRNVKVFCYLKVMAVIGDLRKTNVVGEVGLTR